MVEVENYWCVQPTMATGNFQQPAAIVGYRCSGIDRSSVQATRPRDSFFGLISLLKILRHLCEYCVTIAMYGAVCIYSLRQLYLVHQQDELSCVSYECWFPRTIQRQVQFVVTFLTATRASFFLVAIFAWDESAGEVNRYRGAFYSLDELATIAFFSLACVLALFWAEVYYIAIDQVREYRYLIRPMTYAINVG
eukprot:gene13089-15106_t